MNASSMDFSLHSLEARFEMQYTLPEICDVDCGSGGGGGYGYYGDSWGNLGSGDGYVGNYQVASDHSGAMLDDGTFTDGTSGSFPGYTDPYICLADPNFYGCPQQQQTSRCNICRC
jgi:hypothetical protein